MSVVTIVILIVIVMFAWPPYNVWRAKKTGEAQLAQAEQNRKIKVFEAEAELESAQLKAKSEIARAEGAAKANEILGSSLTGKHEYLRYLWINAMSETQNQVIYIPTESGLPILEATRLIETEQLESQPRMQLQQ